MERKKKKINSKTNSLNLSSLDVHNVESKQQIQSIEEIEKKIFDEINDVELQKSLIKWEKDLKHKQQVSKRDFLLLKNSIEEYMNTFILFGYNIENERVIIQKFENSRDRDAIMEFLKIIFIKQQTENFLE
jgi:hypothetical protein